MSLISNCKVQGKLFWTCWAHGWVLLDSNISTTTVYYFYYLTLKIRKHISGFGLAFSTQFGEFHGPMFSSLIKFNSCDGYEVDWSLIEWLDAQHMLMQLTELKSSTLWVIKFAELWKQLETTAGHDHWTKSSGLSVWRTLHWLCWQSSDQHISVSRYSRAGACVQLKVTKHNLQII